MNDYIILALTLHILTFGIAQQADNAHDMLVEQPRLAMIAKGEEYVFTVSFKGGIFKLPIYQGTSEATFIQVEEGFFTQSTDITVSFDEAALDILKYFDESSDRVTVVSPTLNISFPFKYVAKDVHDTKLIYFKLPLLSGYAFVQDDVSNAFNEAIGQLYLSLGDLEQPVSDVFSMWYEQGFINTVTLQNVYENFADDAHVKLSTQIIEVLTIE